MTRHLSARARLTVVYTSLFAVCGGVLVVVTYFLLAHNLGSSGPKTSTDAQTAILRCMQQASAKGVPDDTAKAKCTTTYANGVKAGASAQRGTALDQLLLYSLVTLGGATVLAAAAGWIIAGRILRPVHQLTVAARTASEQNLSHRLALSGPRDELRELADTFDAMLARLENAFTSQRQFIANASHELRTPLTVMRTSVDVVLAKPNMTPDDLVSMSTEVRQAVEQADRLIDALLTLARSDHVRPVTDPLDLATIAENALDGRDSPATTTVSNLGPAPVIGDGVLLERLIGNLLDNAERYNVPGGRVAISTSTDDGVAVLHVVNTGEIVPADQVGRLFEPFTRLDDRTRHAGFGLGLAIVKSIATMHRGHVDAAAVATGGLDVTVRLPRRST